MFHKTMAGMDSRTAQVRQRRCQDAGRLRAH
jgi:hypothetical protein